MKKKILIVLSLMLLLLPMVSAYEENDGELYVEDVDPLSFEEFLEEILSAKTQELINSINSRYDEGMRKLQQILDDAISKLVILMILQVSMTLLALGVYRIIDLRVRKKKEAIALLESK